MSVLQNDIDAVFINQWLNSDEARGIIEKVDAKDPRLVQLSIGTDAGLAKGRSTACNPSQGTSAGFRSSMFTARTQSAG